MPNRINDVIAGARRWRRVVITRSSR